MTSWVTAAPNGWMVGVTWTGWAQDGVTGRAHELHTLAREKTAADTQHWLYPCIYRILRISSSNQQSEHHLQGHHTLFVSFGEYLKCFRLILRRGNEDTKKPSNSECSMSFSHHSQQKPCLLVLLSGLLWLGSYLWGFRVEFCIFDQLKMFFL